MKTALIVSLFKQSKYWDKIFTSIQRQSELPDCIYVLVDRPEYDIGSINLITSIIGNNPLYKIIPIYSSNNEIDFMAGYVRNVGLQHALEDKCECFIFTDGDCILQKDLVRSHKLLCNRNIPMLTVGRRREQTFRWMDQREYNPNMIHLRMFEDKGIIINTPELLKKCLVVWSCNIALNKHAVDTIYKFNKKYYNKLELFNSVFNGKWGGEDSFLGITSWYCRIFIHTVSNISSGVEHIDHPRPSTIYTIDHKKLFDEQCDVLRKKVTLSPVDIDIFTF